MVKFCHSFACAAAGLSLGALAVMGSMAVSAQTPTNVTVRVVAANLTSGVNQCYEAPGVRIFQSLKPDIVAIQELNYGSKPSSAAQIRSFVNAAFGTNFTYFRETSASYSIPNGIISRYPILASGSWEDHDTGVNDRGFAWAQIDLPGTNDLYVVSVHLKASSGSSNASRRAAEAAELKALISTNFPADAWVVVGGDLNLYDETEGAIATFKTFLSDSPVPADAPVGGDADTNEGRTERYDRLLVSFSLTNCLTNVVIGTRSFPSGLVFDSAVFSPLSDVSPVASTDSHVSGMQHMAVVKDFRIPYTATNPAVSPAIAQHPQPASVSQADTASFTVTATGTPPLHYQWRFNNTDILGATASSFSRTNAQPEHVGSYSVLVTNLAGGVISSNAALHLIVPAPSLLASSDGLRWQGLSNLSYTVQSRTNLVIGDWQSVGQTSSPAGTLTFPFGNYARDTFFRVVFP